MKQDVLEAWYDDGFTYLKVHTKYGNFSAWAECKEQDSDVQNKWDGYKFCEYKIELQILKAKYKIFQERANGMRQMLDYCRIVSLDSWTDETWSVIQGLEKQYKIAQYQTDALKKKYKEMEARYPKFCEDLLDLRRAARIKNFDEESTKE